MPNNTAANTSFSYLGEYQKLTENDFSSQLIQMGARLYIPKTGIFTSSDPVEGGNENAYVYPTDPVNKNDITGQKSQRGKQKNVHKELTAEEKRVLKEGKTKQNLKIYKRAAKKEVTNSKNNHTRASRASKDIVKKGGTRSFLFFIVVSPLMNKWYESQHYTSA